MNLIEPLNLFTDDTGNKATHQITPPGTNSANPHCGKFYRENHQFSLTNKLQEEKKGKPEAQPTIRSYTTCIPNCCVSTSLPF